MPITAAPKRPLLARLGDGLEPVEQALDAERRALIHANEKRLQRYLAAAEPWAAIWPRVAKTIADLPLKEAHKAVCEAADGVLPQALPAGEAESSRSATNS
ncbi:MAG: hypothetical protein JXR37_08555 [Kiritimatiellae bacterium]|nr:hypothetical protein [Kiritimatiellia bacterium]